MVCVYLQIGHIKERLPDGCQMDRPCHVLSDRVDRLYGYILAVSVSQGTEPPPDRRDIVVYRDVRPSCPATKKYSEFARHLRRL